jgi:hypothetical protein
MRTPSISAARCAAVASLIALAAVSTPLTAQQANASAAAFGMDFNHVAFGQGLDAAAWNPAMLGLSKNPAFTLNLFTVSGVAGLAPVSWNDFAQYAKSNDSIPSSVRHTWLNTVTANGGENGNQNGSVNWIGISFGHLALQLSSSETMQTSLNPGVFQALMFGNAGNTGSLQNLNFAGSGMNLGAFTTAAGSYGVSFGGTGVGSAEAQQSIGVTIKYVVGNFLLIGQDQGSTVTASGVAINFPVVVTNTSDIGSELSKGGSGFGADIGYAWRSNKMTFSAVGQNIFNAFKWDVSQLESRPGTALFNGTTNSAHFDSAAFSAAPQSLQQAVSNYTFKPAVLAGIAYQANRLTTLTADVHEQFGDSTSILIGPKTQVGGGIEFRGIPLLPLRAGVSYITGGWTAAAGVGLALGGYELGVSGLMGHRSGGNVNGVLVSVMSFR